MGSPRTHIPRDPAQPSPKEKPKEAKARKKKPRCLFCVSNRARALHLGNERKSSKAFCSLKCAARWACLTVEESAVLWCIDCQRWTDLDGSCPLCTRGSFAFPGEPDFHPDDVIELAEGVDNA